MFKFIVLFFLSASYVFGQTWISRARLVDHTGYFSHVMQETIYEVERRGFSNLKLVNVTMNVYEQMYDWLVSGIVTYTNGFVLSIQKIDVTNMEQIFGTSTIDNVATPVVTVRGQLHLRDVKLGYDVIAELGGEPQRYTGDIVHTLITYQVSITQNINTKQITVGQYVLSLSGGLIRMVYRPANNVTEVLSRLFFPYHNSDGVDTWGPQIFHPIILDIVTNRIPFPEICFSNC